MASHDEDLFERLSKTWRRIDVLKATALNDPTYAGKLLDTLEALQIGPEDHSIEGLPPHGGELNGSRAENDDHYSTLIQVAFESIAVSEDGIIIRAHEDFAQDNGYELSEVIGRPVTDFLAPEEHERVIAALRSGEDRIGEYRALKKDGSVFVVEAHGRVIERDGKFVRVTAIRDITERKLAEQALQESERKYHTLFNSMGEGFCVIEKIEGEAGEPLDFRYVEANPAFKAQSGISDVVGKTIRQVAPEEPEEWFETYNRVLRTGKAIRFERELVIRGRLLELYAYPVEDETHRRIAVTFTDITDRKITEEALSHSEAQLRSIIENSLDMAYRRDLRTDRFDYVSPTVESIIGFSVDEMMAMSTTDMVKRVHPDDLDIVSKKFKTALEGSYRTIEYRFKCKDGKYRWFADSINILVDSNGNPLYRVGVVRDIAKRKKAEEELRKHKDELEMKVQKRTAWLMKANEALHEEMMKHRETEEELRSAQQAAEAAAHAKSEFLANMSHEIRTPMNAVIGMAGLLMETDLTLEQHECVRTIRTSGDALLSIISDILDFSKIDSGKMEIEHSPFNLAECIESAMDLLAGRAYEKGIDLSYVMADEVPAWVYSDIARLRQVLVNLLSNAIKFTDKGSVGITITRDSLDRLHFAIKDTGIGIPMDKVDRLFQSFTQVDSSTTRRYGGTGLGLAISKRLVELMGGRIWVESILGEGSIFHFTIKADVASAKDAVIEASMYQRAVETAPLSSSQSQPLSILVAEDNAVNQKVALLMLKRLGYCADVAANGIEVLDALERRPYDVILMDVQMPEVDGIEAARAIRRQMPAALQPKIIAMTAYALEGDREKCIDAGMDGYIAKPVQMGELADMLKKFSLKAQ